jgi:hypothetical protein
MLDSKLLFCLTAAWLRQPSNAEVPSGTGGHSESVGKAPAHESFRCL